MKLRAPVHLEDSAGGAGLRLGGVSVAGSIPLLLSPAEAELCAACPGLRRSVEWTLVVAHGGENGGEPASIVERFRLLNINHAALLEDILDVAPLDRAKVERIVARKKSASHAIAP